jgi:radical SAM-linked protein
MPRLLFEKVGNAVWISHLDLMRLFQRAFKRAGLHLTHTPGFNPRPSVSIALPLSVGVSSICELLDFELSDDSISCDEIKNRLNDVLIRGVTVKTVYDNGRKVRDLSLLSCEISLKYDVCLPSDAADRITALFAQKDVIVPKKTKNGIQDQNIVTMIRRFHISRAGENILKINCLICCQNPTLNPAQISYAISKYLPDLAPSHTTYNRVEIYDNGETIFR